MSWRLAPALAQLRDELDDRWPDRTTPDWTIGDDDHRARASDHNPNDRDVVCAIDVRGAAIAEALWRHLLAVRDRRLKYAIFNREIVSSTVAPWRPRPYNGTNPHLSHIHISVGRGPDGTNQRPDLADDRRSWQISTTAPPPPAGGTVDVPLPLLQIGDRGGPVQSLQALLVAQASQDLAIDGNFGRRTEASVERVQAFFDLRVDGVVGQETWPTLFL